MKRGRSGDLRAVPIREVRWACDCKVGGGDPGALVHHVGCASQGAARRAPLVTVAAAEGTARVAAAGGAS